jgi:hypothetical protein
MITYTKRFLQFIIVMNREISWVFFFYFDPRNLLGFFFNIAFFNIELIKN